MHWVCPVRAAHVLSLTVKPKHMTHLMGAAGQGLKETGGAQI